ARTAARVLELLDRAVQRRGLLPEPGRHAGEGRSGGDRRAVLPGGAAPRGLRALAVPRRARAARGRGVGKCDPLQPGARSLGTRYDVRVGVLLHGLPPGALRFLGCVLTNRVLVPTYAAAESTGLNPAPRCTMTDERHHKPHHKAPPAASPGSERQAP